MRQFLGLSSGCDWDEVAALIVLLVMAVSYVAGMVGVPLGYIYFYCAATN